MKRNLIWLALFFMTIASASWASNISPITISDLKANPAPASAGGAVVISCRVSHSSGLSSIERVFATLSLNNRSTSYSRLYDDGSHGDSKPADGVFSLQISAPPVAGEARVIFSVLDESKVEVESDPLVFSVK